MSKIFIDTNILIYSLDNNDKKKKQKSRTLLKGIVEKESGVISTQVIQEFYVSAVKKLGVASLDAKGIINSFKRFETVVVTPEMINNAIDCSILNRLSFWDSLIVVSAEHAKCSYLFTEDLNHGQIVNGVEIVDPFVEIPNK